MRATFTNLTLSGVMNGFDLIGFAGNAPTEVNRLKRVYPLSEIDQIIQMTVT